MDEDLCERFMNVSKEFLIPCRSSKPRLPENSTGFTESFPISVQSTLVQSTPSSGECVSNAIPMRGTEMKAIRVRRQMEPSESDCEIPPFTILVMTFLEM
jgi:hypothetical protein